MELEGLDWANAEVMLLEDNASDEQEALLVVPAQGASGQRLWGRGRPPIDEERALYAKIRVKKTTPQGSARPQLQVVRPAPERPEIRPVVRKGTELKPAFKYCPYRYYGKLSSFRRALCQDSWRRWYRKQWQGGGPQKRAFAYYNLIAQQRAGYPIASAWDRRQQFDLRSKLG